MNYIETDSNLASDLMLLLSKVMLSEYNPGHDGEQTRIVIEHPDGSYEPYTLAWYDKENNIIRLSYGDE